LTISERVLGISPFEHPDPRLVLALGRAGALGVLDLGRDEAAGRKALARLGRECARFGVRVPEASAWSERDLPKSAQVVIVDAHDARDLSRWQRTVLVQVVSIDEAERAKSAGATGLVVKGSESGGRVGEETSFVLLQRLASIGLPLFVQGGVGLHTAAACIAGGAAGVVLDSQLALVRESAIADDVKSAIRRMDGSETVVLGGHRVFTRPDLAVAALKSAECTPEPIRARLGADLEHAIVPAGQDAAFARSLAERFRTAGGVVHAIESAIDAQLEAAIAERPLDAGSPLAKDHGVRYPIAQGPMTRVSDRASFADAVSRGGGVPFLALALMRGDELREVLRETSAKLEGRAWGVGILGFVPEETREEQLAVIRELRPPVAIIAGGRPAQARPLEALGTTVYLHVPSPGLLDLFLDDGARNFVFEGRECGGHVGPRTSFVLWELQLERLLAMPDPSELRVLFAGGIHDARSAAMVAAMAAPLAARGAKIGVLMGTAYLFTEEAVACSAIEPGFQAAAIACDRTILLETAPGHATRCTDSEYAKAFAAEKTRLEREGRTPEETWEALEQLNLGRLRIASKGLERREGELVRVDAGTQAREGMFMIGQVAALRSSTLTIAELHREVSIGSSALLDSLARPAVEEEVVPADVAIIGISCIFPDAPDLRTFWSNVVSGKTSIVEVPKDRWDADVYYDASSTGGEKTRSKWGGFVPPTPFDPLHYGIPPKSMLAIEPVQLLSLEVAKRALEDAGYYGKGVDHERTSVIFGAEAGTDLSSAYGFRALYPQYAGPIPAALDAFLPKLTEDSFPGVLANVIAGRIANRLDLGGVNYTVDAACASSLAAVDLAVKELANGVSDMVLCGGADLHNSINDYLLFSSVHALSPTGACKTFDSEADGIALGEGVACVVLKRLADAERDGDRIYAVIKAVAGSSDGRSLGLTAPRKEGQMRALERAYEAARVSPAEVELVEAHGTGTVVGDKTELGTLTEVYRHAGAERGSVVLGSVKSQIGHTKCAAGLAGLVKVALALHHRVLPPTMNLKRPNPAYDADSSPFVFTDRALPWASEDRKAAVSAFGFGGTNFHAVLASYDSSESPASGREAWPAELFLFHANARESVTMLIDRLEARLDEPGVRLGDLARTISERRRRDDGAVELAIVARSIEDLREKLRRARTQTVSERGVYVKNRAPGKLAFLFSGQGSQRPGMLADVFVAFPALHEYLALGQKWVDFIYPPLAFTPKERGEQARAITDTRVAQPALGIVELALSRLMRDVGVKPDMVAGHSYGELVALAYAEAIAERDLLDISAARGEHIVEAAGSDPGTMAAVSAPASAVTPHLVGLDDVVIANHNAPDQTVISGPTSGIERAMARLLAAGLSARTIQVACAFHSPVVKDAARTFAGTLADVSFSAPKLPVYSNTTARPYPADGDDVRSMLAEHVALPVRFVEEVEAMYAAGARVFVEVGPGRVLTGLAGKTLADRPHVAVPLDGEGGLESLLEALAVIAVSGVAIDVAALHDGRQTQIVDLGAPVRTLAPSTWLVDGQLARPIAGEIPEGGLRPVRGPIIAPSVAAPPPDREVAVLEYLRSTREIVEAQRQVVLKLLGDSAPEAQARALYPSVPPMPSFSPPPLSSSVSGRPSASDTPPMLDSLAPSLPPAPKVPTVAEAPSLSLSDALLNIVSERTGYPREMLDLDLNLEAELGIDSIKRIEILGKLSKQYGFASANGESKEKVIEKLATLKTLRAIVEFLEKAPGASSGSQPPAKAQTAAVGCEVPKSVAPKAAEAHAPGSNAHSNGKSNGHSNGAHARSNGKSNGHSNGHSNGKSNGHSNGNGPHANGTGHSSSRPPAGPAFRRYVLEPIDAPIKRRRSIAGRSFALIGGAAGLRDAISVELRSRGASLVDDPGLADGLLDLGSLDPANRHAVQQLFDAAKRATKAKTIVSLTRAGAPFVPEGAAPRTGVAGLLKTLAKELGIATRAVGVEGAAIAEIAATELACDDAYREVAYVRGARKALHAVAVERPSHDRSGGGNEPKLGPHSVVLVTGGARGITAAIAISLAKRFGCRFELVGRSPLPEAVEDPELAHAHDLPSLRRAILARASGAGRPSMVEIERTATRILGDRAVRGTLKAIADAGASVRYHALDVRDERALGGLLDDLYREHGRIDGVVHGAGILEDKLFSEKTRDSFDRVFDTKVASARTIAAKLRDDVSFVAFFGSVSGAFGNRGQVDYAAANDQLDKLALWLDARLSARVMSIDWGPWGGGGMVSAELADAYAQKGVGLIDPAEGVDAFLDELLGHHGPAPQVIWMKAHPSRFDETVPVAAESATADA
jgi:acyl transferase domain-containing protein/NAD(P)H-dependent flavin oxidoreductase YrpB (nitropropane dioxygenase family)/NAD(P)-dependent dehydrogenase (short-subunit alcohol dehydrogenase family)/acyl carrier protein